MKIEELITKFAHLSIHNMEKEIKALTERLAAVEAASASTKAIDYSDPPLTVMVLQLIKIQSRKYQIL